MVTSDINLAIQVWAFADQYLMPKLKDQAMRCIYSLAHNARSWIKVETLYLAFSNCTQGSPLYRFMKFYVILGLCSWLKAQQDWVRDANKPSQAKSSECEAIGYSASDLASLERVEGVMMGLLDAWVTAPLYKLQMEPVESYLVGGGQGSKDSDVT